MKKEPICRHRVRQIPRQFSWVDQRLVREARIKGLSSEALALYLFLVVVGDQQGLSYYSDRSISEILPLSGAALAGARRMLELGNLVAYKKPLYQVLCLERDSQPWKRTRHGNEPPMSIGKVLQQVLEQ
jgi:hypothetical protein